MKTIIEPFRIKVVEPLKLTTRDQRLKLIKDADLNPFRLDAKSVLIDLLTDSGTSAMSIYQWAGIMRGDESYAGSTSFDSFQKSVHRLFGHQFVIPTHQGRAAERLLCDAVLSEGDIVPGNTHFDTTRANIENSGAEALDIPVAEARDPQNLHPFKGNIDLALLAECLEKNPDKVPFVLITITNNSAGGHPVSLENIKAARKICDQYKVPLFLDAARFAENAWFIKIREEGQGHRSATEIAKEVFSYSDGALMSMKKDAFGNIGGVLSVNSADWAAKIRTNLIMTEGFPTYGGLAGRDLEALAIGLEEVLEEDYLEYRIRSTAYVGEHLAQTGVPVVQPFGRQSIRGLRFTERPEVLPHFSARFEFL
ncbi:MAG: tryptophanase [Acidobacteria bacterium]|nr:tryptophanase [Acidobacteriota bacterium]